MGPRSFQSIRRLRPDNRYFCVSIKCEGVVATGLTAGTSGWQTTFPAERGLIYVAMQRRPFRAPSLFSSRKELNLRSGRRLLALASKGSRAPSPWVHLTRGFLSSPEMKRDPTAYIEAATEVSALKSA